VGVLYRRYQGALHAHCLRNLEDEEDAADVVQEAFVKAWLALRRGFEPEAPYPWLLTIARNLCVSRHRARSARIQTLHFDESHEPGVSQEGPTDDLIELRSMLQRLPERQRRALLLHEVIGLPYREVAAELNISYAAVATLVFRTRRRLAQDLAHCNAAAGEEKPRRSLGLGWLVGIFGPCSVPAKLGQHASFLLDSGTPVKLAAALGVAPLVMIPSLALNRGRDGGPARAITSRHASSPALLERDLTVSFRMSAPNSSTRRGRVTVTAAAALAETPPVDDRGEGASPEGGGRAPVQSNSRIPRTSHTGSPKPPAAVTAVPPPSIRAEDATRTYVPPVPSRHLEGNGDSNPSLVAPPPHERPQAQVEASPADSGSQDNGSPADPGSEAQSHGPPADPGSEGQSHGPPADPGSEGQSHGPPADPGSQGQSHGSPADPGSQPQSHGPPANSPPGGAGRLGQVMASSGCQHDVNQQAQTGATSAPRSTPDLA
jgi:RNA polymerase sigma-70 factor (ECF subfamily)